MGPHQSKRHKELVQNDTDISLFRSIPWEFFEDIEASFDILRSFAVHFRQETGDFYRGKRCIWHWLAEFNTSHEGDIAGVNPSGPLPLSCGYADGTAARTITMRKNHHIMIHIE